MKDIGFMTFSFDKNLLVSVFKIIMNIIIKNRSNSKNKYFYAVSVLFKTASISFIAILTNYNACEKMYYVRFTDIIN